MVKFALPPLFVGMYTSMLPNSILNTCKDLGDGVLKPH